jgi:hypothetical protein
VISHELGVLRDGRASDDAMHTREPPQLTGRELGSFEVLPDLLEHHFASTAEPPGIEVQCTDIVLSAP